MNKKYQTTVCDEEFLRAAAFHRSLLPKRMHGKLLDLGCHKAFLKNLLPESIEYTGVNIDKTRPFVLKYDLNGGGLPFKSKYFDFVVATDVLEHLFCPEKIRDEIFRVMKDEGIALVSLPNDYGILSRFFSAQYGFFRNIPPFEKQKYFHHWVFSIESAAEFLEKRFKITGRKMYNGRIMGKFDFLLQLFPGLCSTTCFLLRK